MRCVLTINDIIRYAAQLFNLNNPIDRLIAGDWIEQLDGDETVNNLIAAAIRSNILISEMSKRMTEHDEIMWHGAGYRRKITLKNGIRIQYNVGSGAGNGIGSGSGNGEGPGNGLGSGLGLGSGYGLRHNIAPGIGTGIGVKYGSGTGAGSGAGYGTGYGTVIGHGQGYGSGHGNGYLKTDDDA